MEFSGTIEGPRVEIDRATGARAATHNFQLGTIGGKLLESESAHLVAAGCVHQDCHPCEQWVVCVTPWIHVGAIHDQ